MDEFALFTASGELAGIVTATGMTQSEVAARHPEHRVVPVAEVPQAVLERYQFWYERP